VFNQLVDSEIPYLSFIAIDVEAIGDTSAGEYLAFDPISQSSRLLYIQTALDEVRKMTGGTTTIIYTRNLPSTPPGTGRFDWGDLTGCTALTTALPDCFLLSDTPLWDVQDVEGGSPPDLANFKAYGVWTRRLGEQYCIDDNGACRQELGLSFPVDLDLFDRSLFPGPLNPLTSATMTPVGTNVTVQPVNPANGANPATVAFSSVTGGGATALTTSSTGTKPPGLVSGSPATFYYCLVGGICG